MLKAEKETEKHSRLNAILLVLAVLLVVLFAASVGFRVVRGHLQGAEVVPSGLRVEVLNGSSHDKVGRKVAVILRRKGLDVVNIDNAQSHDFAKTVVVDRVSADMRYAKIVARKIGCREIAAQPDPSLYLEVSVIVGNDCGKIFPEAMKEDDQ
jgi:hypothetical protein